MDQIKAAQEISTDDQRQIPTAWNKAVSVKMQPLKSGDENWTLSLKFSAFCLKNMRQSSNLSEF